VLSPRVAPLITRAHYPRLTFSRRLTMRGGARVSVSRAANAGAAVARERTADCRGDLFGLSVHGEDRASLQHLAEVERLADGRSDDEGRARVASSEPAQDPTPLLLFEVERRDDEVGSLDGDAGLEPVEGAARRRISGRVGERPPC
jgi:hypothetical protein